MRNATENSLEPPGLFKHLVVLILVFTEIYKLCLLTPKKIPSYNIIILWLINLCLLELFTVKVIETQHATCDFSRNYFSGGSFCQDVTYTVSTKAFFWLPEAVEQIWYWDSPSHRAQRSRKELYWLWSLKASEASFSLRKACLLFRTRSDSNSLPRI